VPGQDPNPHPLDLQALNTLRLRSYAPAALRIDDPAQVPGLAPLARSADGLLTLGGGSNLVLPPLISATVACIGLRGIEASVNQDSIVVEAAAGERWHDLVAWCVARGYGGLENLALIPGMVGAAPVQNIGAYGVEIGEFVEFVSAYDFHNNGWVRLSRAACGFGYRDSIFKREPGRWLITGVRLVLPTRWRPRLAYPDLQQCESLQANATPQAVFEAVTGIRRRKLPDPARLPNAGSFFKNPVLIAAQHLALVREHPAVPSWPQADGSVKIAAAWLIDQCGWKGRRLGPVGMHERHALVLVNHGGAAADDVHRLTRAVQEDVLQRFGVALEREPIAPQA